MIEIEKTNRITKSLRKLTWTFIALGIIEVLIFIYLNFIFIGIINGFITIIPVLISMNDKRIKWKYFIGIWTLIKYNPFFGLAQLAFILGHLREIIPDALLFVSIIFMVISIILSVFILVMTRKYEKLLKEENLNKNSAN